MTVNYHLRPTPEVAVDPDIQEFVDLAGYDDWQVRAISELSHFGGWQRLYVDMSKQTIIAESGRSSERLPYRAEQFALGEIQSGRGIAQYLHPQHAGKRRRARGIKLPAFRSHSVRVIIKNTQA